MQSVKIEINGQMVDVDKGRIPLSFSRLVDKWEEFVGSEGTRAKALSDTLYLPATKRNSDILSSFDTYDYNSQATQNLLFVQVFVNGISVFAGYGQRLMINKRGILRDTFAIKILGDATDVFSRLEGLSLRDLPMGDAGTTHTDMEASWTNVSVTDNPLVFAPIYYGGTNNRGNILVASGYQYTTALRPSVRIWKIIEAIFEKQLGYEIVSNIYRTDMFRNLVYPFGVGDDWKRTDDVSPYTCYIGASSGQNNLRPQARAVKFTVETPPFSDPQNMNTLGGIFRPLVGGWYVFKFNITGNNIQRVVLRGSNYLNQVVNINLGEFAPNVLNVTEPILFEPGSGLVQMLFTIEQDNPSLAMSVSEDSFYIANLTDRFAYPYPLDIASCLHDKPQKDFLKGVQHLFGLVFGIDNINKRVYIDPRFFNATTPITIPEGIINQRDSYYEVESEAQELRLDAETELSHRRPFGDSLALGFAEDSNDALYSYLKEQSADNYAIPLYGSKIDFIASDKQGTTSRNPFFAPLLSLRMYSSPNVKRRTRWGCIVEDFERDILTSGSAAPETATYRCEVPKIAMYYGVLLMPFDLYAWGYVPTIFTSGSPSLQRLDIPLVLGVFPNEPEYMNALGGLPFNVTYSNVEYNHPTPYTSLGLINRYHQKYLSMIYNDKWLSGTSVVDLISYRADLFKQPKLAKIGGQLLKCWQAQTNSFNPIEDSKADISLILDYDNIDGNTYTETEQGDNPLLTTGYILEISNTGE